MEEDFKKALEGALGRKYIDSIVEQVMDSPARFDNLYALTRHEDKKNSLACYMGLRKTEHPRPFPVDKQKRRADAASHTMPS